MEAIHHLWDEMADFGVERSDAAVRHLKSALCCAVGAWNATWAGAVRLGADSRCLADDPLQGWRVAITRLLHPIDQRPNEGPFREILDEWDRREIDPSFLLPMRGVGQFRNYSFRRDLPPEWFDSPFYQSHYASMGVHDAVFVAFPLNAYAESHFGFYSRETFSQADIDLLSYALRSLKWFHRQVMLTHGALIAQSPLTPAEQKVLKCLLTEASEKQIAEQIGLATSTVHQYVVTVYRKYGVNSRAGLMSLWLSDAT